MLIFIYPKMGLLVCKFESFWQDLIVVSDTYATVKARGPFVCKMVFYYNFMMYWQMILHDTTSESLLYGHDKQSILLFLIYPYISCYNHILSVRVHLDEHKHGMLVFEFNRIYIIFAL